jgi:hypothetical protein
MIRTLKSFVVASLILLVPSIARAQAKQGDKEIGIGGSFFSIMSTGSTTSQGQFDFSLGYFLTDRFEVAFAPTVSIMTTTIAAQPAVKVGTVTIIPAVPASTNVDGDGGISGKIQYFFGAKESKVKPYLGFTEILQSFKAGADGTYSGVIFGVKNYFSDRAALDFNGQYGFRTNAPGDFQLLTFTVGITYLF